MTERTGGAARTRVLRPRECYDPPVTVRREVVSARPLGDHDRPPVLLVPGLGHGAWAYGEHWLEHVAGRGFPAYAMSVRGHGGSAMAGRAELRAYVHDVVQVAAGLPRQAVLVGHGAGATLVTMAMARYPVRAAVLVAPVVPGLGTAWSLLSENPLGTLPALFGGSLRLGQRQLFSAELPEGQARQHLARLGEVPRLALWRMVRPIEYERAVGDPPVLVVGSPDDRITPRAALERVARRDRGAPLLFPGMGHDMMLDARWREPADAICDWLAKLP